MASKWAWRAGELLTNTPRGEVCRHRVAQLGLEMLLAGEKFVVVTGSKDRSKDRHTWIEYGDEILEPTSQAEQDRNFPFVNKLKINSGSIADDLSFIHRIKKMYKELGKGIPDQLTRLYETKRKAYLNNFWPSK
jgi:hypothetical protein